MSIINDALKRAAKSKKLFQNKPSPILSAINEIKTDTQRFFLRRWLVWAGTGAVCLLGIVFVTTFFKQPDNSVSLSGVASQEVIPKEKQKPQPVAVAPKKNRTFFNANYDNFDLSGILYDQQKPLAIINERIVGEGSLINGAKLLRISPNSVKLSLKGKQFSLRVK